MREHGRRVESFRRVEQEMLDRKERESSVGASAYSDSLIWSREELGAGFGSVPEAAAVSVADATRLETLPGCAICWQKIC